MSKKKSRFKVEKGTKNKTFTKLKLEMLPWKVTQIKIIILYKLKY